jgi:hypothetical protein
VPAITINAQGQITSAANTSIAIAASQITSGTLGVARGGTGTGTAFTAGSLVFAGASGVYSQDNANLFWDDSNNYLGIGTATPAAPLNVSVSTSGDAVRITQTGAGNALVVEDSANPDATPFVVDASGFVIQGYTANLTGAAYQSNSGTPFSGIRWNAASTGPSVIIGKSRSATIGTNAIVQSGDTVGSITFNGDDGAAFIPAASIVAAVDGTPGTNDMPGRLIFNTTADGASTTTERMRIDSSGNVGIGTSSLAGYNLRVSKSLTGAVTSRALLVQPTVQSDVTTAAYTFQSIATTAAASFTLPALFHYAADQGTFGAGSTVTNQYGFFSSSGLISATTNFAFLAENTAAITAGKTSYGFYSAVNTATGGGTTWGFYAAGTAANYFAGQVQLGAGTVAAPALSTTGDTNTGIFFPAADTIAFSEGGVEVMRINSSGNVGIGTSSPAVKLAISSTDAILVPVGTTGERPTGATGYLRFNSSTTSFEGYNGTAWGSIGGGATGGGTDQVFYLNGQTVNTSYSIPAGQNAGSFGPITVASGAVVTVPSGSTWTVV